MEPHRSQGQASWLLVDALGLPAGTVQPGLSVDDAQWARLVDTARKQRFAGLPLDEGFHQVGRALGEALFHTDVGRALKESMAAVTTDRAWAHLIPHIALRLRQPYGMQFERTGAAQGQLTLQGQRALRPQVTLGLLEVVGRWTNPPSRVALATVTDELLSLDIRWE